MTIVHGEKSLLLFFNGSNVENKLFMVSRINKIVVNYAHFGTKFWTCFGKPCSDTVLAVKRLRHWRNDSYDTCQDSWTRSGLSISSYKQYWSTHLKIPSNQWQATFLARCVDVKDDGGIKITIYHPGNPPTQINTWTLHITLCYINYL